MTTGNMKTRNKPQPLAGKDKSIGCHPEKPEAAAPAGMPRPGPACLERLIEAGYDLLEKQRFLAACDMWLEAWDMLRLMMPGRMCAIEDATLLVQ